MAGDVGALIEYMRSLGAVRRANRALATFNIYHFYTPNCQLSNLMWGEKGIVSSFSQCGKAVGKLVLNRESGIMEILSRNPWLFKKRIQDCPEN